MIKQPPDYDILYVGDWRIPIPRWANWIAMDSSGVWYSYQLKPMLKTKYGCWMRDGFAGEQEMLGPIPDFGYVGNWKKERWNLRKEAM